MAAEEKYTAKVFWIKGLNIDAKLLSSEDGQTTLDQAIRNNLLCHHNEDDSQRTTYTVSKLVNHPVSGKALFSEIPNPQGELLSALAGTTLWVEPKTLGKESELDIDDSEDLLGGTGNLVFQHSNLPKWEKDLPDLQHLGNVVSVMSGRVPPHKSTYTDEMVMNDEFVYEIFLRNAYLVRNSIGRIMDGNKAIGTGFRVSKRLIMTAAHVAEPLQPGNSSIQFHHYEDVITDCPAKDSMFTPPKLTRVKLDQNTFSHINKELDYAIMATEEIQEQSEVGIVKHIYVGDKKHLLGKHINILSHPGGSTMKVSMRKNLAVAQPEKKKFLTFPGEFLDSAKYTKNPDVILDEADTDYGSSGAPMFNDDFQLIGIHQGWTGLRAEGETDPNAHFVCNRGCLISSILNDMYSQGSESSTKFEQKLGNKVELGVPFEGTAFTKNFCSTKK